MLSALSTPTECYPKIAPTNELLIKLSEKNAHFLVSLMNFIALAREEAEKVTPLSLTTIENPQLQQATIALNQLNFSIKKYIMNCALEQINHSYNLTFPVQPAKTMGFTISAKTNTAVIGCNDNRIYIWDLKKNNCTKTLINTESKVLQKINIPDHSCIVAILGEESPIIKIWRFSYSEEPYIIQAKHYIQKLHCGITDKNSVIVRTYSEKEKNNQIKAYQRIYLLKKNELEIAKIKLKNRETRKVTLIYQEGNYQASNYIKKTELTITKNNCHALYLCEQAIKNSTKEGVVLLPKITQSQSYQSLTDYEKEMVDKKIQEKTQELLASQQTSTSTKNESWLNTLQKLIT
jgi:hypothetical protein